MQEKHCKLYIIEKWREEFLHHAQLLKNGAATVVMAFDEKDKQIIRETIEICERAYNFWLIRFNKEISF